MNISRDVEMCNTLDNYRINNRKDFTDEIYRSLKKKLDLPYPLEFTEEETTALLKSLMKNKKRDVNYRLAQFVIQVYFKGETQTK
ncbi:hypothetical protein ACQKK5_07920 [Brevibacillus panacihumi]|uniref:hypothetical protein n=1 Tax=Brevibacillus panacihumi TaxID=497735 RepID=UPI003D06199C